MSIAVGNDGDFDTMTTRRERAERKRDKYFEEFCKKYTENLPVSKDEKDKVQRKCVSRFKALPTKQHFMNIWECASETNNPEDFQKCIPFKVLNEDVPFFLPETSEEAVKQGICEIDAFKAPDALTELEFREWCYAGITPPKVDFKKGIQNHTTKNISPSSEGGILPSIPEGQLFHTPQQAVTKTGAEPEEQAQEITHSPASHTITITRKFRLKRVYEENPVSTETLTQAKKVMTKILERFEKLTNRQIRAGVSLPDETFKKKKSRAITDFYKIVRETPSMETLWNWRKIQDLQLNGRLWRCAAQNSYFALRDYKTRSRLLTHFTDTLQSLPDPSVILEAKFPPKEVFSAIYANLPQLGEKLTEGQVSRVFIGNTLRGVRNIVKRGIREKYGGVVTRIFNAQPTPPHLAYELAGLLARVMRKYLKSYLNTLSRQLTEQVKRTLKHRPAKRALPKTKQQALIRRILKDQGLQLNQLSRESWGTARAKWWKETKELLEGEFKNITLIDLANRAVQEGQAGLTPERVLNLVFSFRPRRLKVGTGKRTGFENYLVQKAVTELEYRRITLLRPHLTPLITQILNNLLANPRKWLKLPHFQKQTIPFGQDDRRAYRDEELSDLYILASHKRDLTVETITQNVLRSYPFKKGSEQYKKKEKKERAHAEALIHDPEKHRWFEQVQKRKVPISIRLLLEPYKSVTYTLETPKRFISLVKAGYIPRKATLIKEKGDKLILAIPFEKDMPESQCLKRSDLPQIQDPLIRAGLDLGLKTPAVLSIGRGDKLVAGDWGEAGEEFARKFLDMKQLIEGRGEWFKPLHSKANPPDYKNDKFPNFKRRLANLRREVYNCQRKRDAYRNKCRKKGVNYRHKQHFWDLNSELKRIWQSVSRLHDELTRQIATRILAVCEAYHVHILRLEDLRWARHSKKNKVGYFLASNQIHWFFGQVQARIADLAPRKGILVEWVKAKHTSTRCSKCGYIGKTKKERKKARKGKVFKCPKCNFQLDADLNAARNIRVASISNNIPPSLYALVGGTPLIPLGDESLSV